MGSPEKKHNIVKHEKPCSDFCPCGPDETSCPAGCCPEANWFCCPDMYCAPTAADCPSEAKKTQLVEVAKSSQCDGVLCPNGLCCHYSEGACCSNNLCVLDPAQCP